MSSNIATDTTKLTQCYIPNMISTCPTIELSIHLSMQVDLSIAVRDKKSQPVTCYSLDGLAPARLKVWELDDLVVQRADAV